MKLLNAEAAGKERASLNEMLSEHLGNAYMEDKAEDVLDAYDHWKKEINAGRVLRK